MRVFFVPIDVTSGPRGSKATVGGSPQKRNLPTVQNLACLIERSFPGLYHYHKKEVRMGVLVFYSTMPLSILFLALLCSYLRNKSKDFTRLMITILAPVSMSLLILLYLIIIYLHINKYTI